jgi:hypothetical protein
VLVFGSDAPCAQHACFAPATHLGLQVTNTSCDPSKGAEVCAVSIGVIGFAPTDTYFILVATTSNAILLTDGGTQSGTVNASNYQYYMFYVTNPNATVSAAPLCTSLPDPSTLVSPCTPPPPSLSLFLTECECHFRCPFSRCADVRCCFFLPLGQVYITVTPLSGDPDMYVSTTPNPIRGNSTWRASSMGSDTVQITPTDVNACTAPCRYYIGVTGFASQATYTIRASSNVTMPTILTPGLPTVRRMHASLCPRSPCFVPSRHPLALLAFPIAWLLLAALSAVVLCRRAL